MASYYLNNRTGNDANDGSLASPWKELTKIADVDAEPGDVFYLDNQSVWEYDIATRVIFPTSWNGTKDNPVRITSYTTDSSTISKPTIKWNRVLLSSDWTTPRDDANNAWVYTAPWNVGNYCLVRTNDQWLASRTDVGLPLPSVEQRYHTTGTSFYMYAPADKNPTQAYGEIKISLSDVGFFTAGSGRGFVHFSNLRFEECGAGIAGFSSTAANTGITVDNVEGHTVSALITAVTTGASGQLYVDIKNCYITNWGSCAIWCYTANGEGIKELEIKDNNIHDGMHNYSQAAIYFQVRGTNLVSRIHDNKISKARWGTRDKAADGCAIYCETGSSGTEVYRNLVWDCYTAFQDNSGRANTWHSNVCYNCKSAMKISDDADNNAMNIDVYNNTFFVGAPINPTFGKHAFTGIEVYKDDGTITGVKIRNNVIYNVGVAVAQAAILTAQINPSTTNYTCNSVFGFDNVARREYSPFTVETSTGSLTVNPQINISGVPLSTSPLINAASFIKNSLDFNKSMRHNPPSIGAFEYYAPRGVR